MTGPVADIRASRNCRCRRETSAGHKCSLSHRLLDPRSTVWGSCQCPQEAHRGPVTQPWVVTRALTPGPSDQAQLSNIHSANPDPQSEISTGNTEGRTHRQDRRDRGTGQTAGATYPRSS